MWHYLSYHLLSFHHRPGNLINIHSRLHVDKSDNCSSHLAWGSSSNSKGCHYIARSANDSGGINDFDNNPAEDKCLGRPTSQLELKKPRGWRADALDSPILGAVFLFFFSKLTTTGKSCRQACYKSKRPCYLSPLSHELRSKNKLRLQYPT